jgi:hypothetical protein
MFSHIRAAVNSLMFRPAGFKIPIILGAAGFAVQIFLFCPESFFLRVSYKTGI